MFVKGTKVFADAYKYLKYKNSNSIGFVFEGDLNDFEELDVVLDIEISNNMIFWNNRNFIIIPKHMDYNTIKECIVKLRYNIDDQTAIILNKDIKISGELYYNKMQEYRAFASVLAKKIVNHIETVKHL